MEYRAFYDPVSGRATVSPRPPRGTPGAGRMFDRDYYPTPEEAIAALVDWARWLAADRDKWYGEETVFHRIVKANDKMRDGG